MANKYINFITSWKIFGSLNSINSLDKVIKFFELSPKKRL